MSKNEISEKPTGASSDGDNKSFRDDVAQITVDDVASGDNLHFSSTSARHRKLGTGVLVVLFRSCLPALFFPLETESYHINLISIGGTVGTALFIYMGSGLTSGGPANLLLGYLWWTSVILAVSECQRELVVRWPTDAAFSRNAARYVDPAFGFATGWNFWAYQTALVIFEVTAFGIFLDFWPAPRGLNAAVPITVIIVLYALLNL